MRCSRGRRVSRWLAGSALTVCLVALVGCTPDEELTDRQLFAKYCAECHGPRGAGDEQLLEDGEEVDLLVSRRITRGDRVFVRRRIADGYDSMPSYEDKVSPETLERLVEITLGLPESLEPTEGTEDSDGSATPEGHLSEASAPR